MNVTIDTEARALAAFLAERWIEMWNGDHEASALILAEGFRLHLGGNPGDVDPDRLRGPRQLAVYLDRWRSARPAVRFRLEAGPAVDATAPQDLDLVLRWHVTGPLIDPRSGMDWLRVRSARVTEAWSLTGTRPFSPGPTAAPTE